VFFVGGLSFEKVEGPFGDKTKAGDYLEEKGWYRSRILQRWEIGNDGHYAHIVTMAPPRQ
jgi:hypothetical protein